MSPGFLCWSEPTVNNNNQLKGLKCMRNFYTACLKGGRKILQHQEDPRRCILNPTAICFLYSVYIVQRVVLVPKSQDLLSTARICIAERQEDPSTMQTAFTKKILIQGTNWTKIATGHSVCDHDNIHQQLRQAPGGVLPYITYKGM